MKLHNQIHPTQQQLKDLIKNAPKDTPVTMVNIIKYKKVADGENLSGEEVYNRYGKNVLPFLKEVGGRMIWRGSVLQTVIGDESDYPDIILLVTYPSIDHFVRMISNESYQKAAKDRSISLEYGGLLATTTDYSASS